MGNSIFTRFKCWEDNRIIQVINKEAVSVDRSNFLSTHAPLNKIRYERAPQEIADKTESGLFKELRRFAEHDRHTFMVVQGIPGTGKSHLIRWLKEKYEAENQEQQGNDIVILIERAHCNLRGTLLQIIESGAFDQTSLQNHLQRLRDAATKLSSDTLADTILDQIRNATSEVELLDEQRPNIFIRKRVKSFLQDIYVRQELKKAGGPVDRIRKYLSDGDQNSLGNHEVPGFEPNDFNFDFSVLRMIRDGGYKEARELAERLHDQEEPEWGLELSTYFNRLLNYAVGRTTALSADDLKHIFNELRRQLRQQNRQLALFIEDITAFTGIDEGLIDVLATQHTGEGNREFCRLLSVIGITDNYFLQHFPDNMRERITHRLTLNVKTQGTYESDLLNSPKATADLAARYLNAIRLSQEELNIWVGQGAHPENLPNACDNCPFKVTCHSAFGAVDIQLGNVTSQNVGLYPFNETALWTMYQQLNTMDTARTPRTLLTSILGYVLESHGSKISSGDFPPPVHEVGSDFKGPSLYKVAHGSMINRQAGKDAQRIASLVLYWGNRTIDATKYNESFLVGGLSQDVFQAFNLPFIEGERSGAQNLLSSLSPLVNTDPIKLSNPKNYEDPIHYQIKSSQASLSPLNISSTNNGLFARNERRERYTDDIQNWLQGSKLQNYERLRTLLITFIESAIEWEFYAITPIQVEDRVKVAHMSIEGQAGRINFSDCFIFKRSYELGNALQALDYLNSNSKSYSPAILGGHLTFLNSWLSENEEQIVDFVRRPTAQSNENRSLAHIALVNSVLLSCLQGKFEQKIYTQQELFLLLLRDSAKSTDKQWPESVDQAEKVRSKRWYSLMKGVNKKDNFVHICRQSLLQALNCPQGASQNVRFIDTDLALDILEDFEKSNWMLSPMEPIGSNASIHWTAAYEIYNAFCLNFNETLQEELAQTIGQLNRLQEFIGNSDPKDVFKYISEWIETMKQLQKSYQLEQKPSVSAAKLIRIITTLEQVIKEQRTKLLALRLSGIVPTYKEAQEHISFLQSFDSEVKQQIAQLQQRFTKLQEETANSVHPTIIEQTYIEVTTIITNTIQYGEETVMYGVHHPG